MRNEGTRSRTLRASQNLETAVVSHTVSASHCSRCEATMASAKLAITYLVLELFNLDVPTAMKRQADIL